MGWDGLVDGSSPEDAPETLVIEALDAYGGGGLDIPSVFGGCNIRLSVNEFERDGRWFLRADMAREKKDVPVVRSSVCAGGVEEGESTNWVI